MTTNPLHTYHIGLGSNIPDAPRAVADAIDWLSSLLTDAEVSAIYSTPPLGNKKTADYTNAVVYGMSPLPLSELNALLKDYEAKAGRDREASERGVIVIDLDIVTADGEVERRRDFDAIYFQTGYHQLNHSGL